jgi:hypothetical protein
MGVEWAARRPGPGCRRWPTCAASSCATGSAGCRSGGSRCSASGGGWAGISWPAECRVPRVPVDVPRRPSEDDLPGIREPRAHAGTERYLRQRDTHRTHSSPPRRDLHLAGQLPAAAPGSPVPALVVLAAEPLYVLVDTAVVGHLGRTAARGPRGRRQRACRSPPGSARPGVRHHRPGGPPVRRRRPGRSGRRGVQASWLALAAGVVLALLAQAAGRPARQALAGDNPAWPPARRTGCGSPRSARPGCCSPPPATAGCAACRTPGGRCLRARRQRALRRRSARCSSTRPASGLTGSAIANASAQTVSGALFVRAGPRTGALRPRPAVLRRSSCSAGTCCCAARPSRPASSPPPPWRPGSASPRWPRTRSRCSCGSSARSPSTRSRSPRRRWSGRRSAAGDGSAAREVARRVDLSGWRRGVAFAVLIGGRAGVVPKLFTGDPAVHAQAMVAWPWFVGMQPLAGVVFALDGVLIGAGDVGTCATSRSSRRWAASCRRSGWRTGCDLGLGGVWAGLGCSS